MCQLILGLEPCILHVAELGVREQELNMRIGSLEEKWSLQNGRNVNVKSICIKWAVGCTAVHDVVIGAIDGFSSPTRVALFCRYAGAHINASGKASLLFTRSVNRSLKKGVAC